MSVGCHHLARQFGVRVWGRHYLTGKKAVAAGCLHVGRDEVIFPDSPVSLSVKPALEVPTPGTNASLLGHTQVERADIRKVDRDQGVEGQENQTDGSE